MPKLTRTMPGVFTSVHSEHPSSISAGISMRRHTYGCAQNAPRRVAIPYEFASRMARTNVLTSGWLNVMTPTRSVVSCVSP